MQSVSMHSAASARNRTSLALFAPALVFLAIATARVIYVSLYAASTPFWDQWDELNQQLRPLLDGTWHFASLFAAHNEHRVLFTRLTSVVLFAINGRVFDNLVECYANAGLYAGVWALIYVLLVHGDAQRWRRRLLLVAVIALGSLPFDWENMLVGFQNQFYFMELAAVALIGIAAYRTTSNSTLLLMLLLAVASLFTMASGALVTVAACMVVLLRAWTEQPRPKFVLATIFIMAAILALGILTTPHPHERVPLEAAGIAEHLRALRTCLVWPLPPFQRSAAAFAALAWLPLAAWGWQCFRTRRADRNEIFAAGVAVWALLQFAAIAHARGHDMSALSSRYTEIPAMALAANLWLGMKLIGGEKALGTYIWATLVIIASGWATFAFRQRTPADIQSMVHRHAYTAIETSHVYGYYGGQALPVVAPGSIELPYPRAGALRNFLDTASIRAILPRDLFPPTLASESPLLSRIAASVQSRVRSWFHDPQLRQRAVP